MTNRVTRYTQPVVQTTPGLDFKVEEVELFEDPKGKWVRYDDIKHLLQGEPPSTSDAEFLSLVGHCSNCSCQDCREFFKADARARVEPPADLPEVGKSCICPRCQTQHIRVQQANRQPAPPCPHSDMRRVDGHICTSCGGYRSLDEPDAPLRHLNGQTVPPASRGEVTIVTNEDGECVAVTRTDSEHRILSIIWEKPTQQSCSCRDEGRGVLDHDPGCPLHLNRG